MTVLLLGLLVFLGTHSIRIFADDWRTRQIAQRGEGTWKIAFSLMSAVGLGLIVWGYAIARAQPMVLWIAPVWGRHLAGLLNLAAFVLIAGAYVPGNTIKAKWGHPMVLGVKVWAFAHLLANGTLNAVVLFGAFLAWAIADFASARRRDRKAGILYPAGSLARDGIMVIVGIVAWAAFAFLLHGRLIGVRPFG